MLNKALIRPAANEDADQAVPLLLSAGEGLLVAIFGQGEIARTTDFLRYAWQQEAGQYGFKNHWVAEYNHQIVGLITCWHNTLPADFDRQTLLSITHFFGLEQAMEVVLQSQQLTASLHPPATYELGIGHLAVSTHLQRTGVGGHLLTHAENMAHRLAKTALVLDVHVNNHVARAFYRAKGFVEREQIASFVQMGKTLTPPAKP